LVDMGFLAERLRKQTSELADMLTIKIRELRNWENLVSCIRCHFFLEHLKERNLMESLAL